MLVSFNTRVSRFVSNSHILVGVVFNVLIHLANIRFHICCVQWNSNSYQIVEGCTNVSHLLTRYYYSFYLTPLSKEYSLAYSMNSKKLNKGRNLRGVLIFPAVTNILWYLILPTCRTQKTNCSEHTSLHRYDLRCWMQSVSVFGFYDRTKHYMRDFSIFG